MVLITITEMRIQACGRKVERKRAAPYAPCKRDAQQGACRRVRTPPTDPRASGASQCVRESPLLALHAGVMEARVPLGVPLVHVFPRQHRLQLLHLRDTARGRGGGDGEDRVRSL